jgi:hypothetical protein
MKRLVLVLLVVLTFSANWAAPAFAQGGEDDDPRQLPWVMLQVSDGDYNHIPGNVAQAWGLPWATLHVWSEGENWRLQVLPFHLGMVSKVCRNDECVFNRDGYYLEDVLSTDVIAVNDRELPEFWAPLGIDSNASLYEVYWLYDPDEISQPCLQEPSWWAERERNFLYDTEWNCGRLFYNRSLSQLLQIPLPIETAGYLLVEDETSDYQYDHSLLTITGSITHQRDLLSGELFFTGSFVDGEISGALFTGNLSQYILDSYGQLWGLEHTASIVLDNQFVRVEIINQLYDIGAPLINVYRIEVKATGTMLIGSPWAFNSMLSTEYEYVRPSGGDPYNQEFSVIEGETYYLLGWADNGSFVIQ